MRKRINRNAVCSSENYNSSKRAHIEMLKENHANISLLTVNTPSVSKAFTPKYKTIRVFGHEMRVSMEYYNTYCKDLGL